MRHWIPLPAAVAVALVSCGDVVDPPLPNDSLSPRLYLSAALNPDDAHQLIEAGLVDSRDPSAPGVAVAIYRRTSGQAGSPEWILVARDSLTNPPSDGCLGVFGRSCAALDARLESGAVYMVEATADGFPPARGVTRIPGDFEVESATLVRRDGTHVISAEWTASDHVHRYILGARRVWTECINCIRAWTVDVDSTSFTGPLPQYAVDSLGPVPTVEVMAADEHLYAFVTSGLGDQLLTLPPAMNVEGGVGVVGAARYRTRRIDMPNQ